MIKGITLGRIGANRETVGEWDLLLSVCKSFVSLGMKKRCFLLLPAGLHDVVNGLNKQ